MSHVIQYATRLHGNDASARAFRQTLQLNFPSFSRSSVTVFDVSTISDIVKLFLRRFGTCMAPGVMATARLLSRSRPNSPFHRRYCVNFEKSQHRRVGDLFASTEALGKYQGQFFLVYHVAQSGIIARHRCLSLVVVGLWFLRCGCRLLLLSRVCLPRPPLHEA